MTQMTQLAVLHNLTLDSLTRRIADERLALELAKDEIIPHSVLYELIREVVDDAIPDGQEEPHTILRLALENPGFATDEVLHWSLSEWEKAGNECTPITLIRENIYQWLVAELEIWAGKCI